MQARNKQVQSRLLWCQNDSQSILKFEAKEKREEGERNGTRPLVYHDVIMMCTQVYVSVSVKI